MENVSRKIFTNTVAQIILRAAEVLIGILTLGLITRYLGQTGFGYYTTATAILQLFIIVVDLGLYLTLLREISEKSEVEFITQNIFTMRLLTSAVFLVLAILVIALSPYSQEIKVGVFLLSFAFLFASLTSTLTALFQKFLQMIQIAALNLINKILLLTFVLIIVLKGLDLASIFIASSVAAAISFALLGFMLKRLPTPIRLRLQFNWPYWKHVMTMTWPLAVTTALNLIYFKADTVILSLYQSQEAVGLYGASYRVLEIIATFPHMFMGLVMPLLTASWIEQNTARLTAVWQKAFSFFAFLTLPLITGTLIVGTPLMVLIAGTGFETSGSLLKILMLATALIFFGTLYTYMVVIIKRQKQIIKYFAATTLVALIGYFVFIPRYSYWGAAWITVVSELLIVVFAWLIIRKETSALTVPWPLVLKLGLASILMAFMAFLLQPVLPLIPLIVVSAIVYGILSLLFRAVTIRDLKQLFAKST